MKIDPFKSPLFFHPLKLYVILFISGLILGRSLAAPQLLAQYAMALICLVALISIFLWANLTRCLVIALFLPLGILLSGGHHPAAHKQENVSAFDGAGRVTVEGTVLSRTDKGQGKRLTVDGHALIGEGGPVALSGRILLTIASGGDKVVPGDRIRFSGRLKRPRNFGNPGGFDYEAYLHERGIYASSFLADDGRLAVVGDGIPFWQALYGFRKRAKEAIAAASTEDAAAVISAITLGSRGEMSDDVADSFRKSGTAHLLAISGLHMGIVAYFFFYLFRWLLSRSEGLLLSNRAAKFAALLTILPLSIYLLASGMATSAVRAYIMVMLFLLSVVVEREGEVFNTLSAAALVILFIWPGALFEIGFQLSFTAVMAIVYVVPKLEAIFFGAVKEHGGGLKRRFVSFVFVSFAASAGTAPIVAHYFMELSQVAVLSNFFLIPLLGFMAVPLASFGLFVSLVSVPAAAILFVPVALLSTLAISISSFISSFKFASILVPPPAAWEVFCYYIIFLALFRIRGRRLMSVALIVPVAVPFLFGSFKEMGSGAGHKGGALEVSFLSVGQGESTFVRFPGGRTMLIDGGGFYSSSFDTGKMVVRPYLLYKGVSRIDYLVMTHPHPDHMYGLLHLIREFEVGELWTAGGPVIDEVQGKILDIAGKRGIAVRKLSDGAATMDIGGASLEILHPAPGFSAGGDADSEVNNRSIVMRLSYGEISFMLAADLEVEGERKVLHDGRDIRADVIKVPHHGSLTSSSAAFIRKVSPQHAVFTVGYNNRFRFPREEVVKRYLNGGAEILRTDLHGAVSFSTDGKVLEREVFREEAL